MEKVGTIKFEDKITYKNQTFNLVKIQRENISAIYKSEDKSKILRIGDKTKVTKDLENHRKLFEQGYPVAQILESGEMDEGTFYVEQSLGEELFGEIFKKDFEKNGVVSDENFNLLIKESKQLLIAQINNSAREDKSASTAVGVHVNWLIEELPELKDKILNRLELALERLKVFPCVFSHGDYNPYNIFPEGVIDFEDGFFAPVIFDVYGMLIYRKFFPLKSEMELEINGSYRYTNEQIKRYLDEMDLVLVDNDLPKGSDFLKEVEYLKAIWLAVRMHRWPQMQEYRYKLFEELI